MRLDLVIATCARPELPVAALESVMRADRREHLTLLPLAVDHDAAGRLPKVCDLIRSLPGPTVLLPQRRRRTSKTLDTGISPDADYIGLIDADEQIERRLRAPSSVERRHRGWPTWK